MLEKEFGFNYLITSTNKGDYNIASFIKSGYFIQTETDLEITAKGLNFFSKYLNNKTKEISNIFLFLCGLLANFAYTSKIKICETSINDIIKSHYIEIIEELEKVQAPVIENIPQFNTDCQSTLEIIYFVSSRPFRYICKNGLWGLGYIMLYLGLSCPSDFATWFTSTSRKDLQKIYLSFLLDSIDHDKFISNNFLNSDNPLLRIIALLAHYPVLTHNITFDKPFDIKDLNGNFSSKNHTENLSIFILFLKKTFRAKTNGALREDNEYSKALKIFNSSSFKCYLNQKTFKDLHHLLYPISQWNFLIKELDNDETKRELIELQIKNILEYTQNISGMPTDLDMKNIIELEQIAKDFPNASILEHIEKTFNRIIKKAWLPYTYFRNYSVWTSSCIQSLLLLVPLYNISKNNKIHRCSWKEHYLEIKGKYKFYSKELEQLENEILQNL